MEEEFVFFVKNRCTQKTQKDTEFLDRSIELAPPKREQK